MMIDTVLKIATPLIERLFPNPEKQNEAKLQLMQMAQKGELQSMATKAGVITAEINGESWLQRNWRPVTMLTFTGLVVAHWLGWTAPNLDQQQVLALLEIVKIGLGGYVVGRSAEKVAKVWKEK